MNHANSVAEKTINEVCAVLEKHLTKEDDEVRFITHVALAAYVLGCQLSVSEKGDMQTIIDLVIKQAKAFPEDLNSYDR